MNKPIYLDALLAILGIAVSLAAGNGKHAAAAMLRHLNEVEASLRLDTSNHAEAELEAVLA